MEIMARPLQEFESGINIKRAELLHTLIPQSIHNLLTLWRVHERRVPVTLNQQQLATPKGGQLTGKCPNSSKHTHVTPYPSQ